MTEAEQRAAVVAEAISFLGTRYHHMGRLKGVGVDCATLPLCVYTNAGIFEDFNLSVYSPDWHQHREEDLYASIVLRVAHEIDREALGPGDLILFKYGRAFSHGAIVIDLPQIVHAVRRDQAVVYGDIERESELIGRPMRCFSFWGTPDGR